MRKFLTRCSQFRWPIAMFGGRLKHSRDLNPIAFRKFRLDRIKTAFAIRGESRAERRGGGCQTHSITPTFGLLIILIPPGMRAGFEGENK